MFKPTTYSELQKRKKMVIGMHLIDPSDRYHYFNIVGGNNQLKQKTSSISQQHKYENYTPRQMVTLPVTPNNKYPSFFEQSQLLISKQHNPKNKINKIADKTSTDVQQLILYLDYNQKRKQWIKKEMNHSDSKKQLLAQLQRSRMIQRKKSYWNQHNLPILMILLIMYTYKFVIFYMYCYF